MSDEFMRFMAAWALVHESADEGWKAAVKRGEGMDPDQVGEGPDAFVDGLAASIEQQKEQLKASLAQSSAAPGGSEGQLLDKLEELSFEVGELRGRIESLQTSVDAMGDEAQGIADAGAVQDMPGE